MISNKEYKKPNSSFVGYGFSGLLNNPYNNKNMEITKNNALKKRVLEDITQCYIVLILFF